MTNQKLKEAEDLASAYEFVYGPVAFRNGYLLGLSRQAEQMSDEVSKLQSQVKELVEVLENITKPHENYDLNLSVDCFEADSFKEMLFTARQALQKIRGKE